MATVSDIVTRTLRPLKQLASGEEPTAEELQDAVDDLNDMLFAWRIDGIDIAHVTVDDNDTLDVPDDHIQTIRLSLAERIGGGYEAELSPQDTRLAEQGRMALRAYYLNLAGLSSDNPLAYRNVARTG